MIDYFLFQQINNLAGKRLWLDALAIFFADYFQYLLIFLVIPIFKKNWRLYLQVLLAIFLSRFIFTELIRFFYYRPRPFVSHDVYQLIFHNSVGSFPSGHAAVFFALAAIVFFYSSTSLGTSNKKIGCLPPHNFLEKWCGGLFFLAAFLIGLARIFTGLHYPADILAGALIGIFSGWLVMKFYTKITICSPNKNSHSLF